jgi:Plant transposon protein
VLKKAFATVSSMAFIDYFRMGETTSRRYLSKLSREVISCRALTDVYLRKSTKADTRKIVALYEAENNLPGMFGSLDVTKIDYKNCPTALKGQIQGKKKYATTGLQAVVDHNLWFWHAAFGFPGTRNDISSFCPSFFRKTSVNALEDKIPIDNFDRYPLKVASPIWK